MNNDLPVMLFLSALALLFVSYMLNIDLRSRGISAKKSGLLLIEMWVAFICSGAIFAAGSSMMEQVRRKDNVAEETLQRIVQIADLSLIQQLLLLLGLLASIALLVHFLWSLSQIRQQR